MDTTIAKGLKLLNRMAQADAPVGVTAMAKEMGLEKSNVHRTLTTLLALGNDRRAVDVAREALELDPAFEPAAPEDVARLVDAALQKGATQVALALATNARSSRPLHRDTPRNALAAAKILAERLGRDDEARALLDDVAARFPDDPAAADIAAYRAFLARVAVGAKPA